MQFTKLRLAGFKSFVEGTDLLIEQGLTGIVGPNGCGKSNLIDALRWVMGESSAKKMRGQEMDDVIFSGTDARPSRNIGEVVLYIDNHARTATAPFNDSDQLEISRRIEREKGSTYRINGKEVRAHDVQLLFADAATGARSTALVSQGRIGAVIGAKPTERRSILEEAAGITGLHSRRHEAELRLRGAETNLERLDDVLITLDTQFQNLKKQRRQATRYRNLSGHIRNAEATLFHLRWTAAARDLEEGEERLKAAEEEVEKQVRRSATVSTRQAEAASALPDIRRAEAEQAAQLQRLILAGEGLEAEEQRLAKAGEDCRTRLRQLSEDWEREKKLAADAEAAIQALKAELAGNEKARDGEEVAGKEAEESLAAATRTVNGLEERLAGLTERAAATEARRKSLAAAAAAAEERNGRLAGRAADIARQRAAIEAKVPDIAPLETAEAELAKASGILEQARRAAREAEDARTKASPEEADAVSRLQGAESALNGLQAEIRALAQVLETGDGMGGTPLIDSVAVEPGFEAALAAALGEDLAAPAGGAGAGAYWQALPPYAEETPLPEGAEPLGRYVSGPPELSRRLSQIGVVAGKEQGERLADRLVQGQRLVSRDGALWRWDGFTVPAGGDAAASLKQRNRLAEARGQLGDAEAKVRGAGKRAQAASDIADQAARSETTARQAARAADEAYAEARDVLAGIKEKTAALASRLAGLEEAAAAVGADLAETEALAAQTARDLEALPEDDGIRERIAELKASLGEQRSVQVERQGAHGILARAAELRKRRLGDIEGDSVSWLDRRRGADRQLELLEQRRQAAAEELERLSSAPARIAEQRRQLLSKTESADAKRTEAADRLATAENKAAEADKALREAESELARCREERVRAEGAVEQHKQAAGGIAENIAERLRATPGELAELAGLNEDDEPPELEAVERRLERLLRERDTMGPVNLRAEQEADELNEQIETLNSELADLTKAIDKLRQGIAELNREGRKRLLASFKEVDRHFQELFVRLFGGGRAHLALTESDDPLEAGLEIMASPPGKRLQVLSLLSGGEKALTAMALLFGVFLTNPAPICILDEVDAPLDDANVDRFCSMLEDMAHTGGTRFLIITHHRMTMARMDRLFGVTMSERGVSELVSVDLHRAEELRATA
ncbi:MAG: AAA family ATPase [Proteobacteria bacterium]|nr:AAA family ATPase [Pseudomonadota bacterium]